MAEWWYWALGVLGVGAIGGIAYVALQDPMGWRETVPGKEWRSMKVPGYRIIKGTGTHPYTLKGPGGSYINQYRLLAVAKRAAVDHATGVQSSSAGPQGVPRPGHGPYTGGRYEETGEWGAGYDG